MNHTNLYFVQCQNGFLLDTFLNQEIIAVGWSELGNLSKVKSFENLKKLFNEYYPALTAGQQSSKAAILLKFLKDLKKGEYVITFDKVKKIFYIGKIISNYKFIKKFNESPNIKKVEWKYFVKKSNLTLETKYKLGTIRTIFLVNPLASKEIFRKMKKIN